jgi:hypothetical protein
MPREIYLLSSEPVTMPALVAAGSEVDDQLAVRALYAGAAWQLVDEADAAVMTIEGSRLLADPSDIGRVSRGFEADLGALREAGAGTWWTEIFVPWGPTGDPGVRIARNLGRLLTGRVRVEDGQ